MFNDRKLIGCSRLLAKVIIAGSVFLCSSGNVLADLQIIKTVDPISSSPAAENDTVRYNLSVTNIGLGNLTNVVIDDVPTDNNLSLLNYTVTSGSPPANFDGPGLNEYTFVNLAAGQTVTLNLDATVNAGEVCPLIENTANVSANTGLPDSATAPPIEYDFGFTSGLTSNVIRHVTATSFCELCDTGEVHIRITNPTSADLKNITLVENLQSLGLTYVNNSTTLNGFSTGNPVAPGGGPILTWTSAQIGALASLAAGSTIEIAFRVSTYSEASLLANPNRNILPALHLIWTVYQARKQ